MDDAPARLRFDRFLLLTMLLAALSGCTNVGPAGPYGLRSDKAATPTGGFVQRLGRAARAAAVEPATWVPLAGAAVLSIGSLDEDLSDWAARKTPVFGDDAADWSDDLRDFNTLSYFAAAAMAPSEDFGSRLGGLAVGVGTMLMEGAVSEGLKSLSSRQRPNRRGDRSFPSGHASQASSRATLTLRTLRHYELAPWQRRAGQVSILATAGAAAWARVEAQKHYPTDVLVGFAVGSFLANFAHNLFLADPGVSLTLTPEHGGATLSVRVPLR